MDFVQATAQIKQFAVERDWEQFHTPRNLLLALTGEVGELAEVFQWRSDDQIQQLADSRDSQDISDELADIAIYLIRLSDILGVDLGEAIESKIEANAKRYPADEVRGSSDKRAR